MGEITNREDAGPPRSRVTPALRIVIIMIIKNQFLKLLQLKQDLDRDQALITVSGISR